MKRSINILALALIASAGVLVGCGGKQGDAGVTSAPAVVTTKPPPKIDFGNLPGVPVPAVADPAKEFKSESHLVAMRYGHGRSDPFVLKPEEKVYETAQGTERILGGIGYSMMYTPPPEKAPEADLIPDPFPYHRLAGIVVGDSVSAIMVDASGAATILRPGMRIPGTEWDVVSIDNTKAVLRRKGNKTPREVTVKLESPPPGMGGGPTGGPGGPSGAPGAPGGPPPGFRPGTGGGLTGAG
jgi:hypothetical protein